MSRKLSMTVELERFFQLSGMPDDEREVAYPKVDLVLNYSAGSPAVMYQRNGDPGWPAEPAEIEIISAKLADGDGLAPTQEQVDDWAQEWLDSDAGYQYACDQADMRDER